MIKIENLKKPLTPKITCIFPKKICFPPGEIFTRRGKNFNNSISSSPKFIFKVSDLSLRIEVNWNKNSVKFEWELHKFLFADRFSKAKLERLKRFHLKGAPSAVITLMVMVAKYPDVKFARQRLLGYLWVDNGKTWWRSHLFIIWVHLE